VLSRKALTNTSFTSVAELETRIDCWVSHWNDNPEPFVWTKRDPVSATTRNVMPHAVNEINPQSELGEFDEGHRQFWGVDKLLRSN
jgi:hypothetical protein